MLEMSSSSNRNSKSSPAPSYAKYFKLVGFGPCFLPSKVFSSWQLAREALNEAVEADTSGWTQANSRIYGYSTKKAAHNGDIGQSIGDNRRVF